MPIDAGDLDADIAAYFDRVNRGLPVDTVYTGEMLILVQVLREVRRLDAKVEALRSEVKALASRPSEETSSDVQTAIKTLNNMER